MSYTVLNKGHYMLADLRIALLSFFLAFSAIAQEVPRKGPERAEEEKNEQIEQMQASVDDLLTDNDTLVSLRDSELVFKGDETDWDIIKSIPRDAWETVKAPLGWDKKEWYIAGSVAGITALIMTQDHRIKEFVQAHRSELTEDISYFAEMGGSQAQWGLAASYLVGVILKNPKLKKASVVAMSSLIVSGVLGQGLKMLFARERPYRSGDSQWNFHGPGNYSLEHRSFPSGHTTAAFAVASSIATVYDSKVVKALAYTAAALTGISRIHDNKHWASDVFLGAALGTAMGVFITKRHMKKGQGRPGGPFSDCP